MNFEEKENQIDKIISDFKNSKKIKSIQNLVKAPKEIFTKESSSIENANIISIKEDTNYLSRKLDSHQTNIKPRQQFLFFQTPKDNEKKKINFINNRDGNSIVNEEN